VFLLDINACIKILNGSSDALVRRMQTHALNEIALCSVVKAELLYGARKSARVSSNLKLLEHFFSPLVSIPFDDTCAQHYGTIRALLERTGNTIGPNDMLIAATALAHDLTLVTHNVGEFLRVPGLRVEDWEID